jgi:hypothetical protein
MELLASLFDTDVQSAADRIERASLVSHEVPHRELGTTLSEMPSP